MTPPDLLEYNRRAWNRESAAGGIWSRPVSAQQVALARAGRPEVVLTPCRHVPADWLGALPGTRVLGLASGGGQQMPLLAAAGARVTSFDLSDEQLARDREVAQREGLAIDFVRGDMADLSAFGDGCFDLVFHPVSNVFVPELAPVWRECHRVLRPGGVLLAGFMNPDIFLFDLAEDAADPLHVRHVLPYADETHLAPQALQAKRDKGEALAFSHSLAAQIGGQLAAGLQVTGFYDDGWLDDSWPLARHMPVAFATRALRPD